MAVIQVITSRNQVERCIASIRTRNNPEGSRPSGRSLKSLIVLSQLADFTRFSLPQYIEVRETHGHSSAYFSQNCNCARPSFSPSYASIRKARGFSGTCEEVRRQFDPSAIGVVRS